MPNGRSGGIPVRPWNARTPHQAQKKRFDLVILMVAKQETAAGVQRIVKSAVARRACRRLQPMPIVYYRNMLHPAFYMQRIANSAAVGFPGTGLRRQIVVDV